MGDFNFSYDFAALAVADIQALVGPANTHLQLIAQRVGVQVSNQGTQVHIVASTYLQLQQARAVIDRLYTLVAQQYPLSGDELHLIIQSTLATLVDDNPVSMQPQPVPLVLTLRKTQVSPRGRRQNDYVRHINSHDICFGVGPAGTGKTFLAVAAAVEALEQHRVERILLVRPAVEAGEKLGFLPGDLAQKIDPYLRPLYDALHELLGADKVAKLLEKQVIEIAPLAYMRGRTLNHSFVILDEAQNTTPTQMKMFLTRLGFGSKVVVTGDLTQIDLPAGQKSGLAHALAVLQGIAQIHVTHFNSSDVVRHHLVQKIVDAYDAEQHKSITLKKPVHE